MTSFDPNIGLRLTEVSEELNRASDALGQSINKLEACIAKLCLGISGWVVCAASTRAPLPKDIWPMWSRELGYTKINGKWGLALKEVRQENEKAQRNEQRWRFNDAPRYQRVESVNKIPDLLDHLNNQAQKMIKQLQTKTIEAQEFADAAEQSLKEVTREA